MPRRRSSYGSRPYYYDNDDDGYSGYGWRATTPIRSEQGIKAKSKRGEIGTRWWSKRWLETLEALGIGSRLARGRSYARSGQVLALEVKAGCVTASVQGSSPRPYKVAIYLSPLSDQDWEHILDIMAQDALLAARLLSGEMPQEIEALFVRERISLFPEVSDDLSTSCSCPDPANPCKHIAAVYYLLAERFDSDPFMLFTLRGRSKEMVGEALQQRRSQVEELSQAEDFLLAAQPVPLQPLEERLDTFWQEGEELEDFAPRPAQAPGPGPMLRELGDAPYTVVGENLTNWFERIYVKAAQYARDRLEGE